MTVTERLDRPPISVVVPFSGREAELRSLLDAIESLCSAIPWAEGEWGRGDEAIVCDNSAAQVAATFPVREHLKVVAATAERSSYHARNTGATAARSEWLLFMDADCTPSPDLLDAYFAEPIGERCGAVAGQILGDPRQRSLAARYARSRHLFDHSKGLIRAADGGAAAGNLLVRRAAFAQVGGFTEGIRSGGDLDLCRRLKLAGWGLAFRPDALVHHRHRDTLPSLMGAVARYGAGARWLNDRYPGSSPRWPLLVGLSGAARDATRRLVEGNREEAGYRFLDAIGLIAHNIGYLASNAAKRGRSSS